jgi:AcrR family transcriptional regulator
MSVPISYIGNVRNQIRFHHHRDPEMPLILDDEKTKEKIITSVQERFWKEGFGRTSVDEITAGLAMSKKTFYKYFSSKEDLVRKIMERFTENVRSQVERILLSDKSAVEKLSEVITLIGANASHLTPAFGQDIKKYIPQLWKHIEEFRQRRISEVFSRVIEQGIGEGTIRSDVNSRIFLLSVLGVIDRIMQPDVLIHESFSISDALNEIVNIFFRGALTQTGRDRFEQLHHV